MTVAIAPLADDDVDAVCALAREIWRAHYPPIIGEAQTEYMLEQRYRPALLREELSRGDVWWDTLRADGDLVAFASTQRTPRSTQMKLDKLYVHPAHQRRGHGAALIAHACARAAGHGCEALVLAVNKRNAAAIAAYLRHGFRVRESTVTDIGGGFVMDDYVMERRITP